MDSPSTSFLRALPKCEHHLHIEGSLTPSLLFHLSELNHIPLPDIPEYASLKTLEERYKHFSSLDDFLNFYNRAMAVLVLESDFEELAYRYMKKGHEDGLAHAEIFFDPQAHTIRNISLETVINGLTKGLERGRSDFGISFLLTMCFVRHFPVSSALEAVESMVPYVQSGKVIGLGMDSTEIGNPPEKYSEVYERAKAVGFSRLTAHVGEEGTAENVRTAVVDMGINRIDHGIHAADDLALLDVLREKGTFLTVCPLSNVALQCVSDVSQVPIKLFMDKGVKFSINSDDPAYFNGFLLDNYVAVQAAFNLSKPVWQGLMQDAIDNSWCDQQRKDELSSKLASVMEAWQGVDIQAKDTE